MSGSYYCRREHLTGEKWPRDATWMTALPSIHLLFTVESSYIFLLCGAAGGGHFSLFFPFSFPATNRHRFHYRQLKKGGLIVATHSHNDQFPSQNTRHEFLLSVPQKWLNVSFSSRPHSHYELWCGEDLSFHCFVHFCFTASFLPQVCPGGCCIYPDAGTHHQATCTAPLYLHVDGTVHAVTETQQRGSCMCLLARNFVVFKLQARESFDNLALKTTKMLATRVLPWGS